VGNAFPPPVAEAVGRAIAAVLRPEQREELLGAYEMEPGDSSSPDMAPEQMAFPVSGTSESQAPSENRVGDFVSAGA
jgi:DNA (cytosine-5)-methyltransferase 1